MSIEHTTGPRIGSLCTGYGGLDLAVELVRGGRLAWYAETDRHAGTVLAYHWPDAPDLGDIRTVDWTRVEPVDILTATVQDTSRVMLPNELKPFAQPSTAKPPSGASLIFFRSPLSS